MVVEWPITTINDTITPHLDRYGHSRAKKMPESYIYTRNECCPSSRCYWKTSTFSTQDSAKTLSKYVCRLPDETKVENNFHIGQHSCKNSMQISAKLFFLASRKDLESKLCYFNLGKYMQGFPFFERLPDSHLSDFGGDNSAPLGPRLLSYSKGIEQLDTHLAMFRRRLPSRHHMSSTFRVIKAVIFPCLFAIQTNEWRSVAERTIHRTNIRSKDDCYRPLNVATNRRWTIGLLDETSVRTYGWPSVWR